MAIKSGRVGVRHDQVDHYGRIKNVAGGIFSNLSAGSLVSSSSADSSKVNTPSSFTGKIDLTSIKGNTIVWNQQIPIPTRQSGTSNDITITNNGDGSLTLNGTPLDININWWIWGNYGTNVSILSLKASHKYFVKDCNLYRETGGSLLVQNIGASPVIWSPSADYELGGARVANGDTSKTYINVKAYPMLIDLTQMFGSGNEPTTVEQFKSMFPLDYYEYDTGSLLSFKATALHNALTGEEIQLPTLTYFPTGMKSAGSVYDELLPNKAITRVGAVDLGTLTYIKGGANNKCFSTTGLQGLIKPASWTGSKVNAICTRYISDEGDKVYRHLEDKTMGTDGTGLMYFYDSAYESLTVEQFKSAMSGVYLHYELATPVETDIDVDYNLSLNVNEGENLQLLPLGTDTPASAPLRASVTSYKSGATGNDVEKLLGSIAQVETSPATGNHSVGDYIMYNYQLYKVTASITTGASLVVGTNITATTVMDEFKTL